MPSKTACGLAAGTEGWGVFPGIRVPTASVEALLAMKNAGAISDGTPRALEHCALRWCSAHELTELTWADADVPVVSSVQAA